MYNLDLTFRRTEFIATIFKSSIHSLENRQRVFATETNTLLLFRKMFATYCEIDKDINPYPANVENIVSS